MQGGWVTTVWVLGDQLTLENAALAGCNPGETTVLMVESRARGGHLRYHRHKLVLVFSAMRHFADELRRAGWRVDYRRLEETATFLDGLRAHVGAFRPERIRVLEPGDWTTTRALPAIGRQAGVELEVVPTNLFVVSRAEFREWAGDSKRLLMENHYRRVRRRLGVLMEADGTPVGGRWNLDTENRKTRRDWEKAGSPRPTAEAGVEPDAVTREVMGMVDREFPGHPGEAATFRLPVSRVESLAWLGRFVLERLGQFGPYEDLMIAGEPRLFHSVLTPMLNVGLLRPMECVGAAVAAYRAGRAPLESVEGFVRQILGWREFVNGVYWLKGPGYVEANALGADRGLPAWFWSGETEMRCVSEVLREVLATGYNHHIQRLMVLGNLLLLSGVRPREALDWFNSMYVDAYDWVMAANVVGMALHADGGFMATKPYAAGGAYIDRMSDYCAGCRFDPAKKRGRGACPFNLLYWAFIDRHVERFASNPRMAVMVRSWLGRPEAERRAIVEEAGEFLDFAWRGGGR